ncbi:hypothetical protein CTEN210_18572 [Chaetoceros tenuissimus]|uniref:SET domain-containing protein n=1 Tax=Chaetoceros tenuissimus TaxID=426638 RepID=A0AAD3DD33_9STRA|nr:hypothetical protein CTEN210_18572 [Chaetoceros tenuissimus]
MKQQPTLHSDPLSRKEKAIRLGYWTIAKRKRNNEDGNDQHKETTPTTSNTSQCIQVNSTPDKHGIGTFATTTIQAGQILVSQERPIVAHVDCRNYRICNVCFTPIGSLYDFIQHITGGHDEFLDLFDLEKLAFVKNEDIDICKCGLEYCSNKCREYHQVVHRYSCGQYENEDWKKLEEYIDKSDYSILLRLATQCVLKTMTYKYGNTDQDNASLYWWKEYHHPKWWDIQGTKEIQEKKEICKTLSNLLKHILLTNKVNQDYVWIYDLEQHVAEILGMLQCNVMEIRYPSPFAQFKSHLEHFIEDMKEYQRSEQECSIDNNDNMTDAQMKAIEKWIEKYSDEPEEIVGSGLFPILTLANHDCDPNASIEFLNESGLGSMVALRDIPKGEEVAITYIPNGDYDCGDVEGKRFQRFQPTRTWKFLNARNEHDEEDCPGEVDDDDDGDSSEVVPATKSDDINNDERDEDIFDEDDQVTFEAAEGSTVEERQKGILSYDFQCACNRCRKESSTTSKSSPP